MFTRLIIAAALLLSIASNTSADERRKAWYEKSYNGPAINTFQDSIREEKSFLGADHKGWSMKGDARVCTALASIKLPCDYNTRINLSLFLTVNGKGINPESRLHPYHNDEVMAGFPNDSFTGKPRDNAMLAQAVIRNAKLFKNGDLSAEAVKKDWM